MVVHDDVRQDVEDGLLPPLFRQQQLDFTVGMWAPAKAAIPSESLSVFIGNLSGSVTQGLLAELCMQMGPLDTSAGNPVRLLKDQRTGLPKGMAFCDFAHAESAQYAIAVLHDFCLAGQRLRVNPAGGGSGHGHSSTAAGATTASVRPLSGVRRTDPGNRDEHAEQGGGRRRDEDERRDQRAPRRQRRSRSRSRSRRRDERDSRWAERERDGGRRAERWTERDRDWRWAERDEWRGR